MNIMELRDATDSGTKPVVLRLSDGQAIKVPHSDYISFPPEGSVTESILVYKAAPERGFSIVDSKAVVAVEREA